MPYRTTIGGTVLGFADLTRALRAISVRSVPAAAIQGW